MLNIKLIGFRNTFKIRGYTSNINTNNINLNKLQDTCIKRYFSEKSKYSTENIKKFKGSSIFGNLSGQNSKRETHDNSTPEEIMSNPVNKKIYEYKNGHKIKYIFYLNILFIFGHSALLLMEILNPIIGAFHASMLVLGNVVGYAGLLIIGKVCSRVVWRIYMIKNSDKIVIEFLSYSHNVRPKLIIPKMISELELSNIEGFHFGLDKDNSDDKIYINLKQNLFANSQIDENFKRLFSVKIKI